MEAGPTQKQLSSEIQKLSHKRRLLKDEEDVLVALLKIHREQLIQVQVEGLEAKARRQNEAERVGRNAADKILSNVPVTRGLEPEPSASKDATEPSKLDLEVSTRSIDILKRLKARGMVATEVDDEEEEEEEEDDDDDDDGDDGDVGNNDEDDDIAE